MARIGQLYRRSQTGSFYVKIDGKQVKMGVDEASAKKARDKLIAKAGKVSQVNGSRHPTGRDVITLYLDWYQKNRAPTTYQQRVGPFGKLCEMFGDMEARKFSSANLLRWVETHYGECGNTRQRDLLTWTIACFSWVERNSGVPSKIRGTDKPTPDQREFYVPHDQWDDLLSVCSPYVRDFVEFQLYTGARPQEARALAPRHWFRNRFILPAKEAKGGKYPRTIYVPEHLQAKVAKRVRANKYFVFTNTQGRRWSKSGMNSASRRIKERMQMPEFCMYACRHSFAGRANRKRWARFGDSGQADGAPFNGDGLPTVRSPKSASGLADQRRECQSVTTQKKTRSDQVVRAGKTNSLLRRDRGDYESRGEGASHARGGKYEKAPATPRVPSTFSTIWWFENGHSQYQMRVACTGFPVAVVRKSPPPQVIKRRALALGDEH